MACPLKTCMLAAALLPALAGCALTPEYRHPDVPLPAEWEAPVPTQAAAEVTTDWWRQFNSTELDGLMAQAMAANHGLAAAVAAIDQARAAARIAGAGRLPAVEASGSATRSRRSETGTASGDQLLLSVGYEVDLWGAAAAQAEAARARLAASVYDRDALALILQAEVATNYFQALALKDRLTIARENLQAARQVLELVEVRYREGAATGLELAQQRTSVLSQEAQIPALEQDLRITQHALAVLLGQPPQGFAVRTASLRELTLPAVATVQPAALLQRRPDIRRAEARLIAAHADIGAARAALYPSVNLSASAGVTGILTGGSGSFASLAASLAQSIFDGGRRQAQVESAQAVRRQLVEQYAQAVLTSLQEVQDSLVRVAASQQRAAALEAATEQAQEAYRLASFRYQTGAEDLLTLLDSQRTLLQAQDSLVQARLSHHVAMTNLFKALGGGWENAAVSTAE